MTTTPGTGISAEDIDSVAEAQLDMMPETVTIIHRVVVRDTRGGESVTWPGPGIPTIGRLGRVNDQTMTAFAGQLRGKATAMLTVPRDAIPVIREQDRVQVLGGVYVVVAKQIGSYATAGKYLIEEV
jgi:hypothetical protein